MLNIYLGIAPIGFRDFVIGTGFGNKEMDKTETLEFIDSIIEGQLDSTFHLLVKQMLHVSDLAETHPFVPEE